MRLTGYMLIFSHILFFYLAFIEPITGVLQFRKLIEVLKTDPSFRVPFYQRTMILEWGLVAAMLAVLAPIVFIMPGELGLRLPLEDSYLLLIGISTGLILGVIAIIIAARLQKIQARLENSLEPALALLPHTERERRIWVVLSITAGICEELLFRGFVILYLLNVVPWLDTIGALIVSSIVFGIAHAYQGRRGIIATGLLGAALGTLYVVSGSLIPSMAIHALIDLRVLWIWHPKDLLPPESVAQPPELSDSGNHMEKIDV